MSVSQMKKLTVFAHKTDTDRIVKRLIRLRCLDVSAADPEDMGHVLSRLSCDTRKSELEASVARINEAMSVLNRFSGDKRSLLRPRARVDMDAFVADGFADKARFTVEETCETVARLTEIKQERQKIEQSIVAASPYLEYDLPLAFGGTDTTEHILGVLPLTAEIDTVGKELYAAGAVAELIYEDKTGRYMSALCHRTDSQAVASVLSSHGFVKASFRGVKGTAEDYTRGLARRQKALNEEEASLEDKLRGLSDGLASVEILCDLEETELVAVLQQQKMMATENTVMLTGWLPQAAEKRVSGSLDEMICAYDIRNPEEGEKPPVLLKNNSFAANFEWVLAMYSYPAYGSFDPTFIMGIFYFLIFGLMFADVGYGLILVLAGFLGPKILKPKESMKRFLLMFGYCGIACMIGGVLFGAYFGDFPLAFMRNILGIAEADLPNLALLGSAAANVAVLFDPLQNPMGFLIVSLGMGAVHLIAGMAVKFVLLCKEGHVLDAILDIGAYWILFAGVGLIFLAPTVGLWMTVGAAALIVLTHGRAEKKLIMKLLKGLLGLYDLISYVSDLLSYSRILALGLAAGVIAQVVNILATMGGPSVMGFIVMIFAFLLGHLLNLVINVLGTFVHTARLQYIEFFGKFYEDGGVAFEAVEPSSKYTES